MRKTKIIATIGPSVGNEVMLKKLYDHGVNIIRFNFSHANYPLAQQHVDIIKNLNDTGSAQLSMLLDTKGPEIRTGSLEVPLDFEVGEEFAISSLVGFSHWNKTLFCDYPYLAQDVKKWQIIRIDSGLFDVEVLSVFPDFVWVKALHSARVWSKRHINLPGVSLKMPWITVEDYQAIDFAIKNGFTFIALSFVRSAQNVLELRKYLKEKGAHHIKIISKIENQEWLNHLDEIARCSDWLMAARGDLGIEVEIQKLPLYQEQIINSARKYGKIAVLATHLLESMIEKPFPTRAEIGDIFNGVNQKVDCVMLSGETAIWQYPIECIDIFQKVLNEAEGSLQYEHEDFDNVWLNERDIEKKLLIRSAVYIWEKMKADGIIILTKSWLLARLASAFRPTIKVFAFSKYDHSVSYMNGLFGISPHILDYNLSRVESTEMAIEYLLNKGILDMNSKVLAVSDIEKNWQEIPVLEIISVKDVFLR